MSRIFTVELSNGKGRYCTLSLPAAPYEMLDALERCGAKPEDGMRWEIIEHSGFEYLHPVLTDECSIYELNALAVKLSDMHPHDRAAFEGLFRMEQERRDGPVTFADLMTYANSTDGCHVVADAMNHEQLGRFYAENGFVEELTGIPDSLYEKLDFARIGREMHEAEDGVFTRYGYVLRHDDLKPDTNSYDHPPQTPKYAFRVGVRRLSFGDLHFEAVPLDLPATTEQMCAALKESTGLAWEEVGIEMTDSALPGWQDTFEGDDIVALNELAWLVKEHEEHGELPKFKAVLRATGCGSIAEAIKVSYELHRYVLSRDIASEEDMARSQLRILMDDDEVERLEKYLDISRYGKEVLEHLGVELTEYGLIGRRDGEPVMRILADMSREQDTQSLDAQPQDAQPQDAQPQDTQSQETQSQDTQSQDTMDFC